MAVRSASPAGSQPYRGPGSSRSPDGSSIQAPDGAIPEHDRPQIVVANRPLLFVGVMIAALLTILDSTIANVALPHMQSSLGATTDSVTWILTSYIVATAIALPITGFLAARFGRRRLFIVAVASFVLFSMLCGISTSMAEIVVFRIGQGIAGAFIMPLSQSIMLDVSRPSRHPQAMAIWGAGVMIGPILGPVVGGWLTENYDWRWVFFVNVPLGILALILLLTQMPQGPKKFEKFDLRGFALLAIGISALQLLLDRGQQIDWYASAEAWIYTVVALCAGWVAAVHLFLTPKPIFDRALFADRNLVVSMLIIFVVGFGVYATLALLPPLMQSLLGYPVLETGIILVPRGIGVLLSMQLSGYILPRGVGPRPLIALGFLTTALSLYEMAHWSLGVDMDHIMISGLIQGIGLGLIFIPLNSVAFATLPPDLRTDGSSMMNLTRSLGASLGIALVTTLLARSIQINHSELGANITKSTIPLVDLSSLGRFDPLGPAAMMAIDGEINRQSAMIGYGNNFMLMAIVCLCAAPLVLLLRKPEPGSAPPPADLGH